MAEMSGPLFNGVADEMAARMCQDIEGKLAEDGKSLVLATLGQVLQHPTGRYESNITEEPEGSDFQVNDNRMIYGPWLEGTGSRNSETRFKGYSTFRRTAQTLDERAVEIVEPIINDYVERMG